ncbi:hypothetical protein TOTORO_00080 [Serratia phage vB_SmaS-Totoro]|nr:hypothetical protein TOTORO_00080 [Serratia phage vB_SmaS-Totoro]
MKQKLKDCFEISAENSVAYLLVMLASPAIGLIAKLTFWSFTGGAGVMIIAGGIGLVVHWAYWTMENVDGIDERDLGAFVSGMMTYLGISAGLWFINLGLDLVGSSTAISIPNMAIILSVTAAVTPLLNKLIKMKMKKS